MKVRWLLCADKHMLISAGNFNRVVPDAANRKTFFMRLKIDLVEKRPRQFCMRIVDASKRFVIIYGIISAVRCLRESLFPGTKVDPHTATFTYAINFVYGRKKRLDRQTDTCCQSAPKVIFLCRVSLVWLRRFD